MDRREFIKIATYASISTLVLPGCSSQKPLTQQTSELQTKQAASGTVGELIIVEGNEPEQLLKRGFDTLGGIENFIKKGNTVVIKANFSVPRLPEEGCTTNPNLVAGLVKMCKAAGAKEVKVIDHPFNNPIICLEKSGIKKAVTEVGGTVYALNSSLERYFGTAKVNGKALWEIDYSKDVLEADVFINMPILKHNYATDVSIGLKNLMGLVWDRGYFHKSDLHLCIAELAAFKKPNLTIIDAIRGITSNGPTGPGPVKDYNQIIFSTDPVAADAYASTLFGKKPAKVDYIRLAAELGVGQLDWEKLNVKRV
ncbi:DUF362 domain-containing protein [Dendrosporobacter sp. 1207_IL3150]|uniref:DUF362 domain-containing protein n=1 Tax=Dendrosporobacter sp. 1207_IL3150 TaxID=3084054 RepID=UPI002FDA24B4